MGAFSDDDLKLVETYLHDADWISVKVCDRVVYNLISPFVPHLQRAYLRYLEWDRKPEHCMKDMFLIALAQYALGSNHFCHLQDRGWRKESVLTNNRDVLKNCILMGRDMAKTYTHFIFSDRRFLRFNDSTSRVNVVGELDVIADSTAIEIKTTQKFTLEHMVQTYLYACILHKNTTCSMAFERLSRPQTQAGFFW